MSSILIVYASKSGQTEKVARRLAATLVDDGHVVEVADVRAGPSIDVDRYQAIVVGAPVYLGKYPRSIVRFVRDHREALARVPSSFFSVSMAVASKTSDGRAQTMPIVEAMLRKTGWKPRRIELFAGAVLYTRYGFLTRLILKRISAKEGGETDTSRDHEYTDWAAVERFAHAVGTEAATARPRPAPVRADLAASTGRNLLLFAGLLSSLLYVAYNVVGAAADPAYDSASQAISELTAIGAPNGTLLLVIGLAYGLLVFAFGLGIREAAERNRALRPVAALVLLYGALDFLWPFVPMNLRGNPRTISDTLHLVLGGVTVTVFLLTMYAGARALGRGFRAYTAVTAAVLVAFGVLTALAARGIADDTPTPWLGVYERVNIGAFLLWMAVLSVTLLRTEWRQAHPLHPAAGAAR